jgi:L-seryl-tRNA(Ser) seleniumtransferase
MNDAAALFARLPSVERVLVCGAAGPLLDDFSRDAARDAVRGVLDELRGRIADGAVLDDAALSSEAVAAAAHASLRARSRSTVRRVVNATGVVLHTNLGRALLSPKAAEAAARAATTAVALEYDVAAGGRGDRDALVAEHLRALTGAEAATVVNNNAAAVLLTLNTLAEGKEVVVSRGELVEIGGSFRIPDVMSKSGAVLREIGTTNRTHPDDYERAIGADTALLLKVHTSNYRIVGFTATVELSELRAVADRHPGLLVAEDLGAGALVDLTAYGLPPEPVVSQRLTAGADVVTFSGDKLLGGPQCGIIVGRREVVERLRRNPLKRALRCDKMTIAALEATLRIYRFDPHPERRVPTMRALLRAVDELEAFGRCAAELLASRLGGSFDVELVESEAQAGSGSQPEVVLESRALAVTSKDHSPDRIARRFRESDPPIIGRIEDGRFLLDLRTVEVAEDLLPSTP